MICKPLYSLYVVFGQSMVSVCENGIVYVISCFQCFRNRMVYVHCHTSNVQMENCQLFLSNQIRVSRDSRSRSSSQSGNDDRSAIRERNLSGASNTSNQDPIATKNQRPGFLSKIKRFFS